MEFNRLAEDKILNFVECHYGKEIFTPGLNRTRPIYKVFVKKAQTRGLKIAVIAGTNGKGQTAQTLAFLLEAAQLKTALWTSPHILTIRERFQINGRLTSYEDLFKAIESAHQELKEKHEGIKLSFYEFLFFVFLKLSFNEDIDYLILEVGLGGRLDAVNHFDADCACITSISRDHQAILGQRYDLILSEKIAVSRAKRPLFTQFKLEYLNSLTEEYCKKHEILWRPLKNNSGSNYFLENQAMAKELYFYLAPQKLRPEIPSIPVFRGRTEEMTFKGNTLIFIGAHNTEGMRAMTGLLSDQSLQKLPDIVLMSFSKRPVSELLAMLKTLADYFGEDTQLLLSCFEHPKALDKAEVLDLHELFNKESKGLINFVTDWKAELSKLSNQRILVCGSYYFIGEVQRYIL